MWGDCSVKYPHISLPDAVLLPKGMNGIFYWMPKCAGFSINEVLRANFGDQYVEHNNGHPAVFDQNLKHATFYHSHVPALVESGYITAKWVASTFGFAFVRNPWDRVVSLFHYLRKTAFKVNLPQTFGEFVEIVVKGDYPKPGAKSSTGYEQANNLLDWLRPDGVWLPKFVGRFERLQEDWAILAVILGLEKLRLPHRNPTTHAPYQEYYDTPHRNMIAEHFASEIDVFDYIFD